VRYKPTQGAVKEAELWYPFHEEEQAEMETRKLLEKEIYEGSRVTRVKK